LSGNLFIFQLAGGLKHVLRIWTILTGYGSNFGKRTVPDPDPDLNKFSAKFLLDFCTFMNQKVKELGIPNFIFALTDIKKS
jgi:hypothetical protein